MGEIKPVDRSVIELARTFIYDNRYEPQIEKLTATQKERLAHSMAEGMHEAIEMGIEHPDIALCDLADEQPGRGVPIV